MTTTIEETRITTSTNKPESAHIVLPPPPLTETPQAYVMRARVEGFPIKALCGFTWIPSKNPENLPVCQECKDIYEASGEVGGHDDRGELPDA